MLCVNRHIYIIHINHFVNLLAFTKFPWKRSIVGKADFLLIFLPVLIAQAILRLTGMLGVAIRQASSRSPEQLKQRPKRLREEENTALAILIDVASTAALTEENLEVKKHDISSNKTQSFERQTGEICIPQTIFNSLCCWKTCS